MNRIRLCLKRLHHVVQMALPGGHVSRTHLNLLVHCNGCGVDGGGLWDRGRTPKRPRLNHLGGRLLLQHFSRCVLGHTQFRIRRHGALLDYTKWHFAHTLYVRRLRLHHGRRGPRDRFCGCFGGRGQGTIARLYGWPFDLGFQEGRARGRGVRLRSDVGHGLPRKTRSLRLNRCGGIFFLRPRFAFLASCLVRFRSLLRQCSDVYLPRWEVLPRRDRGCRRPRRARS